VWRRVLSAFRFIKAALCRGDFAALGCLVGIVGALRWRLLDVGLHRLEVTFGGRTEAIFETVQRVFSAFHYALLSIGDIFSRNFIIGERYLV
jgi:hypothetical protein